MLDVAESKGIYIDSDNLSKELGVTVVPIIAKKKNGVDKISLAIKNSVNKTVNYDINFGNEVQTYKKLEDILSRCTKINSDKKYL